MLNLLIAIMGDSFDKVIEYQTANATRTKLQLLSNLAAILPTRDNFVRRKVYMFVVARLEASKEEGDDWDCTIRRLTRVVESQAKLNRDKLGNQCARLQTTIDENAKKDNNMQRNIRAHIDQSIKQQCDKVNARVDSVES